MRNVKLLKLLSIPAAGAVAVLMAVPVYAHNLTNATITVGCKNGQVSIDISGNLTESPNGRTLEVGLFGRTSSGTWEDTGQKLTFNLVQGKQDYEGTFGSTDLSKYDEVEVQVVKVSGSDGHDLEINGTSVEKGSVLGKPIKGCITPSPSPSPTPTPTSTPTPTPKASPTPTPSGGLGAGTPGLPNTGVQG